MSYLFSKKPTYVLSETNNFGWTAELTDGNEDLYYDTIYINYDQLPADVGALDLIQPTKKGKIDSNTKFVVIEKRNR